MSAAEATGSREAPGPASSRDLVVAAVAVLLAAAVLYLDAISPLGYGVGFFFIVPFLVVVFGLPRVPPPAAAAAVILLSAVGFLLSPPGIPVAVALVGRAAFWVLVAGIAVFVDRYRRVSRERRALDDRYRALFWRHHTAVLVIDPADGRIVDANPAAAQFYGYPREVLRAMRIGDLNDAPEATVMAGMREAVDGQQAPFRFVHRLASGEERDVEVFSGPVLMRRADPALLDRPRRDRGAPGRGGPQGERGALPLPRGRAAGGDGALRGDRRSRRPRHGLPGPRPERRQRTDVRADAGRDDREDPAGPLWRTAAPLVRLVRPGRRDRAARE